MTNERTFLQKGLLMICSLFLSAYTVQGRVWEETNGMIVIEAEETSSPLGNWVRKTQSTATNLYVGAGPNGTTDKHTGSGFLEFNANGHTQGSPNSPLTYEFVAKNSGLYQIYLRCSKDKTSNQLKTLGLDGLDVLDSPDLEAFIAREIANGTNLIHGDHTNDCFVRLEGDFTEGPNAAGPAHMTDGVSNNGKNANEFLLRSNQKFFGGKAREFVYATGGLLDPGGHANKRRAFYTLKAGQKYKIIVSGRSRYFKLDRIVMRHTGSGSDPLSKNPNTAQSPSVPALTAGVRPLVDAGEDQTLLNAESATTLSGSATPGAGRSIVSYQWEKRIGPNVTLSGANTSTLSLTNLRGGLYVFLLRATDSAGGVSSDEVRLYAYSKAPTITGIAVLDNAQNVLKVIEDGAVINTNEIGTNQFNIQALTDPAFDFGRVRFDLKGPFSKRANDVSYPWKINPTGSNTHPTGSYTLGVYAYRQVEASESGLLSPAYNLSFSVSDDPFVPSTGPTVTGELKKWHRVTFSWEGPSTSEKAATNPFTDYRLDVTFRHTATGKSYVVPGFYAADGNAANTSASAGNIWRAHFSPDETGNWTYSASFRSGSDVAVGELNSGSSAGHFDGNTGSFTILATDKTGRDHRGKGRLQYVGEHFLRFAQTGEYFLKAGSDSPESFLAYEDIDDATNNRNVRKSWSPHQGDYVASEGAPYTWAGGKGTEILGAINYLVSEGLNSFSFLTCNIDGDGDNVFPYVLRKGVAQYNAVTDNERWANETDTVYRDRFDASKLAQWEQIFSYGDYKGMHLHFKMMETENDHMWDSPDPNDDKSVLPQIGRDRKLYFRELVARFGHHLAMNWNLGEESSIPDSLRKSSAAYLASIDPYQHNRVLHTHGGAWEGVYSKLVGSQSALTGISIQTNKNNFENVHWVAKRWREESAAQGKPWVIATDEPGDPRFAVIEDKYVDAFLADPSHSAAVIADMDNTRDILDNQLGNSHMNARQNAVWGNVMAGGAGVEIYAGYYFEPRNLNQGDLFLEDFRSRDRFWDYCRYMLSFFKDNAVPFWEMENIDPSPAPADWEVAHLAKEGEVYVVFLKDEREHRGAEAHTLDLTGYPGTYRVQWYNPRTGGVLRTGSVNSVSGGSVVSLGNGPVDESTIPMDLRHKGKDWVILVRKTSEEPDSGCLTYEAASDFPVLNAGAANYYIDGARGAAAINAGIAANRNKFGRASLIFDREPGRYNITLKALQELDGECRYRLLVNGTLIGERRNNRTTTDYSPQNHVFLDVNIPAGATLSVESNTATNGLIAEGDGTAYARGRWTSLTLCDAVEEASTGSYLGEPHPLPGSIQVEHFDFGPNGTAYQDNSPGNNGPAKIRPETDVDFVNAPGGRVAVGYIAGGEWLDYSVDVTAGTYTLFVRAANGTTANGSVTFTLGTTVIGTVVIPPTGNWGTYRTFTLPGVVLGESGLSKLRVSGVQRSNLDRFGLTERLFRNWAQTHIHEADPSVETFPISRDFDRDGMPDGIEYVMGGDPTRHNGISGDRGPRVTKKSFGATLVKPLPDDVGISVEASPNLGAENWNEVGMKPKNGDWTGEVSLVDEGDHYRLELTGSTLEKKKFFRIVVTE